MIHKLDSIYVIKPLKEHAQIKEKLLELINKQENFEHLDDPIDGVNITRCDWGTSRWDTSRPWAQYLMEFLGPHLNTTIEEMGYVECKVLELWFQQYDTNSTHGWHVHGQNWTNVYYLDMPEGTPKTQFINPYTKQITDFDVKEGDVLTFPSYVIHRAPVNKSNELKTIISWNMDTELKPGLYKNE